MSTAAPCGRNCPLREIIQRELIYFWYYFELQVHLIAPYWICGMALGSAVSVFLKDRIHALVYKAGLYGSGGWRTVCALVMASLLGIASPLCMFGTIPLAASFASGGMTEDVLAAFMMSSVLLNPQLLMYTGMLGTCAVVIRFVSCFLCGLAAGTVVHFACVRRSRKTGTRCDGVCLSPDSSAGTAPTPAVHFFNFAGFKPSESHDTDPNIALRYLKNFRRNISATGPWFLAGIVITALYQRYVPARAVGSFFAGHESFGLLTAAALGVPLYMCGGGTIPLIAEWLANGMSMGAAAAFMITGPATKITNLGALKIVLGMKNFLLYIGFSIVFAVATGFVVDGCLHGIGF